VPPLIDPTQLLLGTVSDEPVERSARPVATARGVALADVPETPPAVVLGYQPEFHPARDHWFADIAMDDGPDLWPFVRLALARYQPRSIDGCSLSPIGLTSWVQPLPTRTTTVNRPDENRVRLTVSGVIALLRAPRLGAGTSAAWPATTSTGTPRWARRRASTPCSLAPASSWPGWSTCRTVRATCSGRRSPTAGCRSSVPGPSSPCE
jgi:hypothetical protein